MWRFQRKLSYSPFTVRCVTIFYNKFLHLLLNLCDVKLKPALIDCFIFASLGSGFMHLPERFLVVVVIFPWLLIFSPLENGEGYSFAVAIKWTWRCFDITFIRWVASRTYSGLWTTLTLIFTLVFVSWNSAKNSSCKLNLFTKRYTVLLNNEITYPMPVYLHHSKRWATKWLSSQHFSLKRPATIFGYFDTLLMNSPCLAPYALRSGFFL